MAPLAKTQISMIPSLVEFPQKNLSLSKNTNPTIIEKSIERASKK
jgi:hypothetical protein